MREVSSARESQSRTKRYACFAATAIAFFFVISLSGSNESSNELKSGQANFHHSTVGGGKPASGGSKVSRPKNSSSGQDFDKDDADSLDEDKEMDRAQEKFGRIVDQQISMNESMLSTEMEQVMKSIKEGLGGILENSGVVFEKAEIKNLKTQITHRLELDVDAVVKAKSKELLEDKNVEFETDLDQDAEDGKDAGKVEADDQKSEIIIKLREGVDTICLEVKDQIKHMAATAEKTELEATFKTKTSSTYIAEISEDQVISIALGVATSKSSKILNKSSKKSSKKAAKKTTTSSVKVAAVASSAKSEVASASSEKAGGTSSAASPVEVVAESSKDGEEEPAAAGDQDGGSSSEESSAD